MRNGDVRLVGRCRELLGMVPPSRLCWCWVGVHRSVVGVRCLVFVVWFVAVLGGLLFGCGVGVVSTVVVGPLQLVHAR